MVDKNKVAKTLELDEGLDTKIYPDHLGYPTVGIGHLLTMKKDFALAEQILDKQVGRKTGGKITKEEAYKLFESDMAKALTDINNNDVLRKVYNLLDDNRKVALINMVFQMGPTRLAGFRKALTAMSQSDWATTEKELIDSSWYNQTKNRAKRIISIFKTGNLGAYGL
ncbi:glycoside hydrolase family protein [Burkholderia pseudomallei]|jgi:lysozyme|uniref:glycoside hydrolase family protein n=1 Tax=Burkholderia pseudomallei TaxID=28450 RepID=UPI0024E01BD2|nr:glycoside hydrolase family protein [Burkholderia pseudomallei]